MRTFDILKDQYIIGKDVVDSEVLFIDDGSSDNSREIIQELVKEYPNVSYYRQENQGPHIARNLGILKSRGEYIVFWDSDDAYTANAIQILIETAEKYNAEIVRGGFNLCNEDELNKWRIFNNDTIISPIEESGTEFIIRNKGLHYIGNVWGALYKRSYLIDNDLFFDKRIRYYEDYAYNWLILIDTKKVISIKNIVYLWAQRKGSLCHTGNISHRILNEVESSEQSSVFMRELWLKCGKRNGFPEEILRMMIRGSYWSCFKHLGSLIKLRCLAKKDIGPKIIQLKGAGIYPLPHIFPKDLPEGYPTSLRYRVMWRLISYEWILKLMLWLRTRKEPLDPPNSQGAPRSS